jgi:gliding motility-associated-like protein
MRKIVFIFAVVLTITAVGQEPTFRKNFNYSMIDVSGRMIQTTDGNFVYCGMGTDFLPLRGFVGKIDQLGNIIWSKSVTSGLATGFMDVIEISPALGGGLLLSGESSSGAFMMRVDNNANLIWAQRYQFPSSGGAYFSKAIQTSDGNFLAAGGVTHFWDGTAYRDSTMPMAIKVNPLDGSIIWGRAYYIAVANPDEHWFSDIAEVSDGYVFVGASSEGTGTLNDNGDYPRDGLIIKTDASGNTIYTQKFGASAQGEGIGSAITLSTGRVLMGGYRGDQACLLRFVGTGVTPSIEWGHRYSGGFLGVHMFDEVMETSDGHYAAMGSYILPLTFSFNAIAIKINNSTGARIHGRTYQGGMSSILPKGGVTSTGSYYLMMMAMGGMGHNYHILKTDVGGVMNNPACPEGDYNPSRSNYIPGLISISPTVHTSVTSSVFTPVIADLNPTVTVECEYYPCLPPPNPTLTAIPNPICAGQSVTLTASGSGPNVTYRFYTVAVGGTAFATGTTTVVTPAVTTTYYVDAEDNAQPGCFSNRTAITVTVHPLPNPNITSNSPLCVGGSINLGASNGAGGYLWSGPNTWSSNAQNPVISPANTTHSGTYSVTVTDGNGCTNSASVSVSVNNNPVVNLGPDTSICSGQTLVLDAGPGYSGYSWNPSGNSQTYNATTSGTYSVTVTDGASCSGSGSIVVTVVPQADATITTTDLEYCTNEPSVNFTAIGSGGTWSGPGITSGGLFTPSAAGAGTHNISYTIPNPCGDSDIITITVYQTPVVNLGPDTAICSGQTLVLDAGPGYSGYSWNPSGNSQTYNATTSGTYSVTVTDGASCSGSGSIVVTVVPQADATITTTDLEYCSNEPSVNFTAIGSGGTWSGPGITSGGLFTPSAAGVGIHNISYSIPNPCGDSDNITITVFQAPVVNLGADTSLCMGDNYIIDAGAGFDTYQWSPSGSSQTLNVNSTGLYSVTVTDSNGCEGTDQINVSFVNQQDATILTSGAYCLNDAVVQFTAVDQGGVWSGNGISNNGLFTPADAGIGIHQIIYNIPGGCGDADTTSVTVFALPEVAETASDASCIGAADGSVVLIVSNGLPPYQYLWSNSSDLQNLENVIAGTYIFTVTDSNGCSVLGQATVNDGVEDCFLSHIYLPNVFSPNGDGQNDILFVRGEGIQFLDFVIYNRWGQKVFETNSQNTGWDGTFKGKLCDPGVFAYYVKASFFNGNEVIQNGSITLVH